MLAKLILIVKLARLDVVQDVEQVMTNFSLGEIDLTTEFFSKNLHKQMHVPIFKKNFLSFLMSIGDYDTIIQKYPDLDPEVTKTAKELLIIVNSKVVEDIARLEAYSPNSVEVIKAILRLNLGSNNLKDAERYVNKIRRSFKSNKDLMALAGQFYLLSGAYHLGINIFKEIGLFDTVNEILSIFTEYDEIKKESSVNYKLKYFKTFYHKLNAKVMADSFTPSIFTTIKFEILKEYLELAVTNRKPGASSLGKIYYTRMKDDYSRYLYIMSLIYDDNVPMAQKELNSKHFEQRDYESKIKVELKDLERQENDRRQEREQQFRRPQPGRKNGSDFLGYYKLLGLTPKANEKQIRKAYLKEVAKGKKAKKNKKEWEAKHIKLNKALEILTNKKSKELYDSGVDPEKQQPEYDHYGGGGAGGFHFQGFEDLGAYFSDFFGNSGRSFRGGRRTQFVFV